MGLTRAFWQGRRVFLTGHTGFKGSWLSLWLQSMGAELTGFALPPATRPNLFEAANVASGMRSVVGDIRALEPLAAAVQQAAPEVVIHMAAQALVRESYRSPVDTFATNVMGTVHLLEAVRHAPSVRAVVVVTTDKCYLNREWLWPYREDEPMGGHDPYSSSKGCAELATAAYRASFFDKPAASIATARAGNVIGGGDWSADRLIPDILAAFQANVPVRIRNPHAIRPWQHVLEPLRGYLMLAERLYDAGEPYARGWNFGPQESDAQPVAWIVEQVARRWGEQRRWVVDQGEHPHEANYLKLDISRARHDLGWHPQLNLQAGLDLVVAWARAVHRGADARTTTLDQITHYMNTNGHSR